MKNKDTSKWVVITAQVFVNEDIVQDLVSTGRTVEGDSIGSSKEAFDYLAKTLIREKMGPSDSPLKIYTIELF